MIGSEQLLAHLQASGIEFAVERHPRIYTMAESDQLTLTLAGMRCKNLLLRDRKGGHYLLVTHAQQPVDLKALAARLGGARLSLASAERLFELLGVTPGALSPLALINDADQRVQLWVDPACKAADLYLFHPLDNGASVQLTLANLQRFLDQTGHMLNWLDVDARQ